MAIGSAPRIPRIKPPTNVGGSGFNDPRLAGLTSMFAAERDKDLAAGKEKFDPLFGMNNPAMAEIIEARRKAAYGQDGQSEIARAAGVQGINNTMATGLRSLRGAQSSSGVRGPAAIGQALPTLTRANDARSALESNIAMAEQQRRADALSGLESTVTGERAGSLGAQFGWGGLGAQDRSGGLQYLTSMDFLNSARAGMGGANAERATAVRDARDNNKKKDSTSETLQKSLFGRVLYGG